MKRFRFIFTLFAVMAIVAGATGYYYQKVGAESPLLRPQGATTLTGRTADVSLAWPSYGEAAIGTIEDGVLATHDSDKPLPTASIAKIVAALSVLAKYPLKPHESGPTLVLTQHDVDLYTMYYQENGSLVGVAAGEQITEYQALQAMLLPSGNNMADTLADWAFGSPTAYLKHANDYVARLGMKDTHIGGASGFTPETVSTASDLVLLGRAVMQNPVLAEIVSQTSATVPVAGLITNTNVLLGQAGIVGIKTGNNDQDKGAYLFAAERKITGGQTITFIGAIMGAPSLWQAMHDSLPLLDSAAKGFAMQTVVSAGDIVGRYNVPWLDESVSAVAQRSLSVLSWKDRGVTATVRLDSLTPPVNAKRTIGSIRVRTNEGAISSVPVMLTQDIPAPDLHWRLLHP